ncbi:MAG: hypothetical protein IJ438_08750 [Clostridia bacterium]|nr:hypothetical protein [Clostridia bacterium]
MKKILSLILLLSVLLSSLSFSALADSDQIPMDEVPAELQALFEAEMAEALKNARSRAPESNGANFIDRASFNGYVGSKADGYLTVDYTISDSMVTVGETVSFEVLLDSFNPPIVYIVGGVIMDENFESTGEIATKSYETASSPHSKGWSYTPKKAGYFNFVFVAMDNLGCMVAVTTNTVQVSEEGDTPVFRNIAIDGTLGATLTLDATEITAGETITAECHFTCETDPVVYAAGWTLYDADHNTLDTLEFSDVCYAVEGETLTFSYTPTQAGEALFLVVATDGEGNQIVINSPHIPVAASASTRIPGDVNDDGRVDMRDALALLKKLADWDVTINESNSDVNGDGAVNMRDALTLLKHLADWDVTLK